MKDCIFCKIVAKEIPSKVVYEDEAVLAFLDVYPITKGHTMIVPKEHYEGLLDIPSEALERVARASKVLAMEYNEKLHADGFNVRQNNGAVAHQEIFHYHLHLVPRYNDDNVDLSHKSRATDHDLDAIHDQLTAGN